MKKKIATLIVFLLVVICVLPVTALAAVGDSDSDGTYVFKILTDTTCEIVSYSGTETGMLTIPNSLTSATYGTFSVTGISYGAFQSKPITGVVVPEGVTYIGYSGFYGCTNLVSVSLPSTLTTMGTSCFSGCTALKNITLPEKVTSIGNSIFYGDTKLETVTMGNKVTSIGTTAFNGCSKLTGITLSNTLESIDSSAFQGAGLTSIDIPGSVETIGSQAFAGCQLTSIALNKGLVTIGPAVFQSASITEITLPDTVTTIGSAAFAGCSKLTKATILNSTATFGYGAFGSDTCTIYGFEGSTADTYASSSGEGTFTFHALYTVTFDSNKGSDVSPQVIAYGDKITKPDEPTRTRYVLAGWYKDAALKSAWDFETDTVSKDTTLYARWYYDYGDSNYFDGNEYDQLKKFLDSPSASEGVTNGKLMNNSYNNADPFTFYNLGYDQETLPGDITLWHIKGIYWNYQLYCADLNGDLDLSNFNYLKVIDLEYSKIDKLKVDNDTALTTLKCEYTHVKDGDGNTINTGITALDLSTCTGLQNLVLNSNSIGGEFDLSKNTALTTLDCSDNAIEKLDLNSSGLYDIRCSFNKLSSIDTSSAGTSLHLLYCASNELTTLTLTDNTDIDTLDCGSNKFTSLNLTNLNKLTDLKCNTNELTSLTLSSCTKLNSLNCSDNNLTGLDTGGCLELGILDCSKNNFSGTGPDVSANSALTYYCCSGNQIESLDLSKNLALDKLSCSSNKLTELSLDKNTALYDLDCSGNLITALDLSANKDLEFLYCSDNQLTTLSVSANASLYSFDCSDNQIATLSLNTGLSWLNCGNNKLTVLDLNANTSLYTLRCYGNSMSSLDTSKDTSLVTLDCSKCGLSSLDLSANTALESLTCDDNNLTSLDMSRQTNFYELYCSGNKLTTLNTGNTIFWVLKCTNNPLTYLKVLATGYHSSDTYQIEVKTKGEGYVGTNIDLYKNDPADIVMYLEAKPKAGTSFKNWTDASAKEVSKTALYNIPHDNAYDLTANFTELYTITATSGNTAYGSVSGGGSYEEGKTVTLTATPNAGYRFTGWYKDSTLVSSNAVYTFAAAENITLKAQFALIQNYMITVTSGNATFGSVSGGGSYEEGKTVTLKATPNAGYRFTGWYKGTTLVSANAEYTFTASENLTLTAQFEPAPNCTITVTSGNPTYGSVSGGGSFVQGASVTLTATANAGYYFAGWYNGATMVSASATYTFNAAADISLTAQFDKIGIPGTITATSSAYNKITVSWSPVAGAKYYNIYRAASADGTYKKIGTTKKTTYVNSGVTTGVKYYYKVAAYTKSYTGKYYSAVASAASALGKATVVTAASSYPTKAVIRWKAVTGATKYQVLRSDKKDGTYTAVKTTSSKTITDTGLIPGTAYYYKVVALRGSAHSADSDIASVTPKVAQATKVKASRTGASKVKITWKSVTGATGYEVYVSTDGSAYSLLTDVKKTSCYDLTAPKIASGYYFKVVAYTTVSGTKYKGNETAAYRFTK